MAHARFHPRGPAALSASPGPSGCARTALGALEKVETHRPSTPESLPGSHRVDGAPGVGSLQPTLVGYRLGGIGGLAASRAIPRFGVLSPLRHVVRSQGTA